MFLSTPTIWGDLNQVMASLKRPITADTTRPYSTLNQKLNLNASTMPTGNEYPSIKCLVIGDGGHMPITSTISNGNTFTSMQYIEHSSEHSDLFNRIPFVLLEVGSDAAASFDASGHCLKVTRTYGGKSYIAYYGKRITTSDIAVDLKKTVTRSGQITETAYSPTSANATPQPPSQTSFESGAYKVSNTSLSAVAYLGVTFTTDDVANLRNVAEVIYGDPDVAVISELGLCTAVDGSANSAGYRETNYTQIVSFIPVYYQMSYHPDGFTFTTRLCSGGSLYGDYTPTA